MIEMNPHISIQVDTPIEGAAVPAIDVSAMLAVLAKLDATVPMRSIRCARVEGSRPQVWRCEFVAVVSARSWSCDLRETSRLDDVEMVSVPKVAPAAAVCALVCRILCACRPFRVLVTYPEVA